VDWAPDQYPAGTRIVELAVRTRNTGRQPRGAATEVCAAEPLFVRGRHLAGAPAKRAARPWAMPARPEESIVGPLDVVRIHFQDFALAGWRGPNCRFMIEKAFPTSLEPR